MKFYTWEHNRNNIHKGKVIFITNEIKLKVTRRRITNQILDTTQMKMTHLQQLE